MRKFLNNLSVYRSLRDGLKSLHGVSLYRNTIYLLSNSVILAATGFFFWIAAARLYSTEYVGLASAIISAAGLLALISTLGLDFALIRFLSGKENTGSQVINSSFTISGLVGLLLSLIYIIGMEVWSPALLHLRENIFYMVIFVMAVIASVYMLFVRHIFVAHRKAIYTYIQGVFFGILRFVPLVILSGYSESFGIIISWGTTLALAVIIGITVLIPRVEPRYRFLPVIKRDVVKKMQGFSLNNHMANLFWGMPNFVLPLIVIHILGAEETAYFYIAWAIANILFMIPTASSVALFAEGSHSQDSFRHDVLRSFKFNLFFFSTYLCELRNFRF